MQKYFFTILFVMAGFSNSGPSLAQADSYELKSSKPLVMAKKKKKKRRKKRNKGSFDNSSDNGSSDGEYSSSTTTASSKRSSRRKKGKTGLALGIGGGWEAVYGNGLSMHYFLSPMIDLHGGAGYNTSGPRFGAGGGMNFFLAKAFAIKFGGSFVYSLGNSGKVTLSPTFTPDDGSPQEIKATKAYEISASQVLGLYGGAMLALSDSLFLNAVGNFNMIIGGNEVTLADEIEFDDNVNVTNTVSIDDEFNQRATEQASAGGLGFSVGILLFL